MRGFHELEDGKVTRAFAGMVESLSEAFPSAKVSGELVVIYARALGDIPIVPLRMAALRAVQECRFFPTVAELRSFVVAPMEDAALRAWSGFARAAEEVGAYAPLDVDDPCAAHALVTVFGGWPSFCQTDVISISQKRPEFLAAYREARRQGLEQGAVLPGLVPSTDETWRGRMLTDGTVSKSKGPSLLAAGREAKRLEGK